MALPHELEKSKEPSWRQGPQRSFAGGLPGLIFQASLRNSVDAGFAKGDPTGIFVRATVATHTIDDVVIALASGESAHHPTFGYLPQGQRTNLAAHNRNFSDEDWVKSNLTVSEDTEVAPDGEADAELLTADADNATIIQDLGVIGSTPTYGTYYLKRKTGTGDIDITLDGDNTWTTVTINSSTWTRVGKAQTLANPDIGIRIKEEDDAIWAWGAQPEEGTFPSTLIFTEGSQVTRDQDTLTYDETDNAPGEEGTVFFEFTPTGIPTGFSRLWASWDSGTRNGFVVIMDKSNNRWWAQGYDAAGFELSLSKPDTLTVGQTYKIAAAWKVDSGFMYADGSPGPEDTSGTVTGPSSLHIGAQSSFAASSGYIRNVQHYNRQLSTAENASL